MRVSLVCVVMAALGCLSTAGAVPTASLPKGSGGGGAGDSAPKAKAVATATATATGSASGSGAGSGGDKPNPFPRGTHEWWEHRFEKGMTRAQLAGKKGTQKRSTGPADGDNNTGEATSTPPCDCKCLVNAPESALPFSCSCKCPKPPRGPKGFRGRTGKRGPDGAPGPVGPRGSRGAKGAPGTPGVKGVVGPKGHKGFPGLPGNDGVDGQSIAGPMGLKGLPGTARRGPAGQVGFQGPKGRRGRRGLAGRPITGAAGGPGQRGRPGPVGNKGDKGPQGDRGFDGRVGPMGPQGSVSADWQKGKGLIADATAQAACAAGRGNAWTTAVRRDCGDGLSCDEICASTRAMDFVNAANNGARFACDESLRLYEAGPQRVYTYGSCAETHCGPNYCCCSKARTAGDKPNLP